MIQHTVAFRLQPSSSLGEADFISRCRALAAIDGVQQFRVLRQVGKKSDFTHALSMVFASEADYSAYNDHPDHQAFVANVWIPNVAEFHELDYVEIP